MRFDNLDTEMRIYETVADYSVLPDMYMVARLDGRGFTKMTADKSFEKPFDEKFYQAMMQTMLYIFAETDFHFTYGYCQSDEISLLFRKDEVSFNRKTRKLDSILASAASGCFSLKVNHPVMFDSRISQLPNTERVIDYFRWRQMDAERNCLSSYVYWMLRKKGYSATKASHMLLHVGPSEKQEMLFEMGVNFNDIPPHYKRGIGVYYQEVDKQGFNPKTQEHVTVKRNQLMLTTNLPYGDEYGEFIEKRIH